MRGQVGRNSVGREFSVSFRYDEVKRGRGEGRWGFGEITGRGTGCVRGEWEDSREMCEGGIGIEGGFAGFRGLEESGGGGRKGIGREVCGDGCAMVMRMENACNRQDV